ncbi:DUF2798 domain-containing protein [Burkholderia sp. MR1-5-21]
MNVWFKGREIIKMFKMPSRYSHFAYGVIQAGLTCSISAAIASIPFAEKGLFFQQWLMSWSTSWLTMVPVVLLVAPFVRRMVERMTTNS